MAQLIQRNVVLLACPTVCLLEVAGPAEVFANVAHKLNAPENSSGSPYQVHLLSATPARDIPTPYGLAFVSQGCYLDFDQPIDTLLICGGMEIWTGASDPQLLQWIRDIAQSARRIGSVCTGAFVLAEAGLLAGKRATTHWYYCERLARDYPEVVVDPEPIFIRQGNLSTSAGVSAGIDLALSMVEEDLGLDVAMRVARALVLYVRRPGSQSQISNAIAAQSPSHLAMRDLPLWIAENIARGLSVEELAAQVNMSSRNFSRKFRQEFAQTPAAFVLRMRTESALRLLEGGMKSRE